MYLIQYIIRCLHKTFQKSIFHIFFSSKKYMLWTSCVSVWDQKSVIESQRLRQCGKNSSKIVRIKGNLNLVALRFTNGVCCARLHDISSYTCYFTASQQVSCAESRVSRAAVPPECRYLCRELRWLARDLDSSKLPVSLALSRHL